MKNIKNLMYLRTKTINHQERIDSLSNIKTIEASKKLNEMKAISKAYLRNKYRLDYYYNNPNSFVSVYNYSWFTKWIPEMASKAHTKILYKKLNDRHKRNTYGSKMKNYIDHISVNIKWNPRDIPYDFSLRDSTNTTRLVSSIKEKIVLLEFWSQSCGSSRKEHKNYAKFDDI